MQLIWIAIKRARARGRGQDGKGNKNEGTNEQGNHMCSVREEAKEPKRVSHLAVSCPYLCLSFSTLDDFVASCLFVFPNIWSSVEKSICQQQWRIVMQSYN